jgi:hypothetical protein
MCQSHKCPTIYDEIVKKSWYICTQILKLLEHCIFEYKGLVSSKKGLD